MRSFLVGIAIAVVLGAVSCGSGSPVTSGNVKNSPSAVVNQRQAPVNAAPGFTKVLIQFAGQPGASEQALVRGVGGQVRYTYHLVPAVAASIPQQALSALSHNPKVVAVTPDATVQAVDAELDNTWGVKRIGAGPVHDWGNRGAGVKVASIDTGVDYNHPELDANYAGGYDFYNSDNDPWDDAGHGTHTSGTIAAEENSSGVVGVAPEARIYALKVLGASGSGYFSDIIAALQWCVDHGIQVTNNSYGSSGDPGPVVEAAFDNSAAAGVLHIASAGNSGNHRGTGNNVGYPARYSSVLAVAATDSQDKRATFSSTGPAVELAAPGVYILSTYPGGGYAYASGTSMASPHVAGTAALVIASGVTDTNGDGLINDEVREILDSTAEDLGNAGRDNSFGFGLVDAEAAASAGGPPPPPTPTVNVQLTTDKSDYTYGTDSTAALTAVVTDENGSPISGLGASAFSTTLNGSDVSVDFAESATAGTYNGSLDLTGRGAGPYTVETMVTDTRGYSGSGSANFTISESGAGGTMHIGDLDASVDTGGHGRWRVNVTALVHDDSHVPLGGATVSGTWSGATSGGEQGTTNGNGEVKFRTGWLSSGTYVTFTVDGVTYPSLTYDPGANHDPDNDSDGTSITASP